MRSMRRAARTILMVLLLLTGGAIVNIAVAWGCAAFVSQPTEYPEDWPISRPLYESREHRSSADHGAWAVHTWQSFGSLQLRSFSVSAYYGRWHDEGVWPQMSIRVPAAQPPDWSRVHQPIEHNEVVVIEDARGWPSHALRAEWRGSFAAQAAPSNWSGTFDGPAELIAGIPVEPLGAVPPGVNFPTPRSLPLRPIWPGFAVNTIFYGVILWGLFFGAKHTRRAIRRRRGLCPACAYPRGESAVCTECGDALPEIKTR